MASIQNKFIVSFIDIPTENAGDRCCFQAWTLPVPACPGPMAFLQHVALGGVGECARGGD